ncbi:50S ribosomal protein L18 [Enterobacteriaceae bacterium ET-AT1-13]|nr:50S ribosomal protein L18 [Enterobacteriaceae bacterium ET-AT1-13]WMC17574.1 MAG: 50S ribosomal protein L18 [Enterobacteriaceae bacterium PSmelAO3-2]WMC17779.1 MAG: 50S ribosomal protein L18 [Enterobacteriaceae bacterium PSmelAO3-1]WMC17982.1 MAG: 50S ribosomal protein L18 [Enterobacteriaceae bacterium PSmelAO1]
MCKNKKRLKRAKSIRTKIKKNVIKLVVFRTSHNIYAQIVCNNKTLLSASTLEKNINKITNNSSNKYSASIIGNIIAKRCIDKGIKKVVFDRSGYKYHGRIKALAESARESGLIF